MDRPRYGRLLCVMSFLALSLLAAAQDSQVRKRLTPNEIEALPSERAGAGTSFHRPSSMRIACSIPTAADAGVC
jgi:hypothetical protein